MSHLKREKASVGECISSLNVIKQRVDDIFHSMYFERIRIPSYVSGDADEALGKLKQTIDADTVENAKINEQINELAAKAEPELQKAFSKLRFIHDTFDLRRNAAALKR